MSYLYVAIGGALGSVLRYGLGKIKINTVFPIQTMLINIIGSLIIGMVSGLLMKNHQNSHFIMLFLKVGFCGGFTTFSSFSLDCIHLMKSGCWLQAGVYIILSLTISFVVLYGTMEWTLSI